MSAGKIVVRHECDSAASPEAVFALLSDSSTYPSWSQIRGYTMERPGRDSPHGVGEIRVFASNIGVDVREEIIEIIPNKMVAYSLLSGLPMRNYRGQTTLEPLPNGGTHITWQSSFNGVAGTGWLMRYFMKWVLGTLTPALARGAEAQSQVLPTPTMPQTTAGRSTAS